ncbi:hypothetical protein, partial [Staphylococcus aureus]|uniref:hypothetical protein n=1 Tax=Staphylococcus aureus TaxID=1280 RepID=UPI001C92E981
MKVLKRHGELMEILVEKGVIWVVRKMMLLWVVVGLLKVDGLNYVEMEVFVLVMKHMFKED